MECMQCYLMASRPAGAALRRPVHVFRAISPASIHRSEPSRRDTHLQLAHDRFVRATCYRHHRIVYPVRPLVLSSRAAFLVISRMYFSSPSPCAIEN